MEATTEASNTFEKRKQFWEEVAVQEKSSRSPVTPRNGKDLSHFCKESSRPERLVRRSTSLRNVKQLAETDENFTDLIGMLQFSLGSPRNKSENLPEKETVAESNSRGLHRSISFGNIDEYAEFAKKLTEAATAQENSHLKAKIFGYQRKRSKSMISFGARIEKNQDGKSPRKGKKDYPIKVDRDGSKRIFRSPISDSNTLRSVIGRKPSSSEIRKLMNSKGKVKSKAIKEQIENFWEKKVLQIFFEERKEPVFLSELFHQEVLLAPLQIVIAKLGNLKNEPLAALPEKTIEQLEECSRTLYPHQVSPTFEESHLRIDEIRKLFKMCEAECPMRSLRNFLKSSTLQLLFNWNLSIGFNWKEPKITSTALISHETIVRSHVPPGALMPVAIADVFLNNRCILSKNKRYDPEEFFTIFLSEIYKYIPCSSDSLQLGEQVRLLFLDTKKLESTLLSPEIDWEKAEKLIKCEINEKSRKQFLFLKNKYFYSMEEDWKDFQSKTKQLQFVLVNEDNLQKLIEDPLSEPVKLSTFFKNDLDLEQEKYLRIFELNWELKYKNYKLYHINSLLSQLIPGFQILQLCTINCFGLSETISRDKFAEFRTGHFYLMRRDKEQEESYHITINPNHTYSVSIPKTFTVHPKLDPSNPKSTGVETNSNYKFLFHWTISPAGKYIKAKFDMEGLLIQPDAFKTQIVDKHKSDFLYILEALQSISIVSQDPSNTEQKPLQIILADE